jgi:hypothetical protein
MLRVLACGTRRRLALVLSKRQRARGGIFMVTRVNRVCGPAAGVAILLSLPLFLSADRGNPQVKPRDAEKWESVEMFAAMEAGDIEVKLIAKSDAEAQIRIRNKTDRPLSVRLPDAFAGVPALAQIFPAANARNRTASSRNNQKNQVIGGPMNPLGQRPGAAPFGNQPGVNFNQNPFNQNNAFNRPGIGFFNVAPEAEGKFKVEAVCLEHGKANPRSSVPYEIKKLETVTSDAEVREFFAYLGENRQRISHAAPQAAAWHLANHLDWKTLAGKRLVHASGASEPYFTADDIQAAMKIVERVKQRLSQPSSRSLSQTR